MNWFRVLPYSKKRSEILLVGGQGYGPANKARKADTINRLQVFLTCNYLYLNYSIRNRILLFPKIPNQDYGTTVQQVPTYYWINSTKKKRNLDSNNKILKSRNQINTKFN